MFEELSYQTLTYPAFWNSEQTNVKKGAESVNVSKSTKAVKQQSRLPTALRFYLYTFLSVDTVQKVIFCLSKKELGLMAKSCYKHILRDINKKDVKVDVLSMLLFKSFIHDCGSNLSRPESSTSSQLASMLGFKKSKDTEYWEGSAELQEQILEEETNQVAMF